jgi:hypothetical protein
LQRPKFNDAWVSVEKPGERREWIDEEDSVERSGQRREEEGVGY